MATDVGDARLLSDGAAILVPAEDPAALAGATTALAVMPWPERERMGLAGRERIRATYSLSRIASALSRPLSPHHRARADRARGPLNEWTGARRDDNSGKSFSCSW